MNQVNRNQLILGNLRAASSREIDPEKWEQMLTTTTVPFELQDPGVKITAKVIDQTGMEHMAMTYDPKRAIKDGRK